MPDRSRWVPAGILAAGCLLNYAVVPNRVRPMPLVAPIESLPAEIDGYRSRDRRVSDEEARVAGMDAYVLREFTRDSATAFSVYVGYYEQQKQGSTIHSPRNCLPGAGWEPVSNNAVSVETAGGPVTVNRYQLARKGATALVYYWYQGRGRVSHNEYAVKLELLRDAALRGRTEEALVRIVVPVIGTLASVEAADAVAQTVAARMVPEVERILPRR